MADGELQHGPSAAESADGKVGAVGRKVSLVDVAGDLPRDPSFDRRSREHPGDELTAVKILLAEQNGNFSAA